MSDDYLRNAKNSLSDYCSMQTDCGSCPFYDSNQVDCELWITIFMINDLIRTENDKRYLEVC